jgi:hypothetical protein
LKINMIKESNEWDCNCINMQLVWQELRTNANCFFVLKIVSIGEHVHFERDLRTAYLWHAPMKSAAAICGPEEYAP